MMKIGIIGGGIAGLMCAYGLSSDKDIDITIFEKGKDISKRSCPILMSKADKCLKCSSCAIMEGLAGAGAFSDGKYNITTEFGGWLQDIIDSNKLIEYERKVDEILIKYGATKEVFMPNNNLKKTCLKNDLYMLQSECKHLGTDANLETMTKLVNSLKRAKNVHIVTDINVTDVKANQIITDKNIFIFDKIVFAVGRSGSSFLTNWCKNNKVMLKNNQVDIGVRVELPSEVWEDFEKEIYEPKILYKTKYYGDKVRMFCFNGRGEVVNENTEGIVTVNGHAYKAEDKKTKNTNFALLSTINFTEPFKQPIEYAKYVAGLANMVSGGSVIVQTLGDLKRGRRTDESRLKKCTTVPTLKTAVPGDLSLCMPKRQLDNIVEALEALNKVAPGTANDDTLLYGVECKYYSARPTVDNNFQIIFDDIQNSGIYAIGDGAGFTRSLAQAGAHGLLLADIIKGGN